MSKEKQIEEMARIFINADDKRACWETPCQKCEFYEVDGEYCKACFGTKALYNAGYRKQSEGKWTKHLDEWDCEYAKCSCCGAEFYDSNGEDTIDMFYKFCPECGAKMKGGEADA